MARVWTPAQAAAMDERSRTLLVCAAAGSGKTAVLTERIIRSLTDKDHPADISRLLVVTFTRAAAGELRQRISKALSAALATDPANTHLSRQLMLLGGASISTIDSFYADIVKRHFQEVGMPASFRMADESELLSLRRELMNATVDEMYAKHPDFPLVADVFCDIRNEASLTDTLLEIARDLVRYPTGHGLLRSSAEALSCEIGDPLKTPFGEVIANELHTLAQNGRALFARTLDKMETEEAREQILRKHGPRLLELLDRCRELVSALEVGDYAAVRTLLTSPLTKRVSSAKMPEHSETLADLLSLCDSFIEQWKKTVEVLGAFSHEEIAQSAERSAKILELLYLTIDHFEQSYRKAKLLREVAEFSDVSRAAYQLLVDKDGGPTPLAREIAQGFDAVYIDEYQDVDAMQDATFRAISTPTNRFMVGDIKQSIYRFRGAQPAVFTAYRRAFPALEEAEGSPEATVFMSDCFRCDENIIRFSNAVSGALFASAADSIGYTKKDDLCFSKALPHEGYESPKCRVVLMERNGEKAPKGEPNPAEVDWIAAEIERLISGEKKADGTPITPGDIAVLVRSSAISAPLAKRLAAKGIACNDTARHSFFENPDVLCVYALLAALDNPLRDVYLASALRSPFFGFSLEELVQLRHGAEDALSLYECVTQAHSEGRTDALGKKLDAFMTKFCRWREKARSLPVDRLLRLLYRESGILSFAAKQEDERSIGSQRRANLHRLYEYARTFEASGFKGLYQFVQYVDGMMENEVKMPPPEGEANAVSIITIHHSKGLEFPVCFVAGTASRMSTKDLEGTLLCDEYLGAALRLPNAGPFSRANTFFREAIARSIAKQNLEEEMRVLYVAMTRARERLYVTANPQYSPKALLKRARLCAEYAQGAFLCAKGPAYIDWILSSLLRTDYTEFAEIEIVSQDDIPLRIKQNADGGEKAYATDVEALRERFAFVYPYRHLTRLPAKLSVSRLSPGVLDVYDTDGVAPEVMLGEDAERLLHTFERTPNFGEESTENLAAARGTATHEFLQFCDFARAEMLGVQAELERLIAERYLSPNTATLVRPEELERFFKSKFYRSLKSATQLRRETRFHIFLPAAEFTKDERFAAELGNERLTVQGVIDLFYFDDAGKLVLCDYKTDRLTPAELLDPALAAATLGARHKEQLRYYAKALEALCGRSPDRILLYSLPLGEALEIEL